MANRKNIIEFRVDGTLVSLKSIAGSAQKASREVHTLGEALRDVFRIGGMNDYRDTILRYGKTMTDQMLVLQLRMGMLKAAIINTVMPFAYVLLPAVNQGLMGLIRFFRTFGQVARILLQGPEAMNLMSEETINAEKSQKKFGKTAATAGKAFERCLASFDQLNRLSADKQGAGSSDIGMPPAIHEYTMQSLSDRAKHIAEEIRRILHPLTQIDFSPARESFKKLCGDFEAFLYGAGSHLEWLWFQVLVPLGKWTFEELTPAAIDMLTEAFGLLEPILTPVSEGLRKILEALSPAAQFIQDFALEILQHLQEHFQSFSDLLEERSPRIQETFEKLSTIISQVWEAIEPVLQIAKDFFFQTTDDILNSVETAVLGMSDLLEGLVTFIAQYFSGDFAGAWEEIGTVLSGCLENIGTLIWNGFSGPMENVLGALSQFAEYLGIGFGGVSDVVKGAINGIISLLNGMISAVTSAVNGVIGALNALNFSFPDWVPGIGGNHVGFSLNTVTAPAIPYLAQGAVLPANRPFLAVVGDQSHGTNVETPLETIKQAVAEVMGDLSGSMLAGFEASVAVQKQILEAVLGIEIGDDVLAAAAGRYSVRQNMMVGG